MGNTLIRKMREFWFRTRGWQALLEMVLIQAVVIITWWLFFRAQMADEPRRLMNNTVTFFLFYCPVSVFWSTMRWRTSKVRPWRRQVGVEFLMAACVLVIFLLEMVFLVWTPFPSLSGLNTIIWSDYADRFRSTDVAHSPATSLTIDVFLSFCSAGFFVFLRAAIRVLQAWNRLRKQHLSWALTHAIMMIPMFGVGVLSLFILFASAFSYSKPENLPLYLFLNLFLSGSAIAAILVFVLPPVLLFSNFFARRITQRIETLVSAASAMRAGNYSIRIPVQGEDEVARLQNDFNAMAAHLEETLHELQEERDNVSQLLNERRELIASVSHELRTPVATMRGYLESTLANWNEVPPPMLRQDLNVINQQTVRLQGLIDDLFALARAEVGKLKLRCAPSHVDVLTQRLVDVLAPLAWRGSRVEIIADVAANLPQALVDEARLEQILQNLLNNGVRYTPPGGIISVSAQADLAHEEVVLQIKDTGEGIPADELSHIWERFYRTEKSRQQPASGTGLGLAIVKEMTEAMGGSVEVESEVGLGTCFTLRFPLAAQDITAKTPIVKLLEQRQQH